jgi:O-antigen/teichoic acid export membrane protein
MNKYKKLAGNTLIFAIGSFGAKILSYLLVRLYTGCMTEAEFSTADLIYQTVNVIYPIVSFCMADAIIRFGIDKGYDNKKVFSNAVFAAVIGLTFFAMLSPIMNFIDVIKNYGFLLYVYCYCSTFRQLASNYVRAAGLIKLFAADGIISMLTIAISNILLLRVFGMGVTGYILSTIISDSLSFIGLTIIAQIYKKLDIKFINLKLIKEMLKYAVPLIPAYVLWWIISASDRWFVYKMVSPADNGVYSVSYKIPGLLITLTTLFFQAWQMSAIENKNEKDISSFYKTVFGAYSSVVFIAAAGMIMMVKPLTYILVDDKPGKNFIFAYHYTPILIIAMVFQCFCQFLSSIYNAHKKSVNSLWTSLAAAVMNVALNFILIPYFKVYGAAIATALSYFTCYAIRIFDARKITPFKVAHLKIAINTLIVGYMAYTASAELPFVYIQLVLLFVVITVLNFDAVMKTLKKILKK